MFFNDVLCPFRRTEKLTIIGRCLKCPRFKRYASDMEKDEDEFFDYCDRVRAHPQGK